MQRLYCFLVLATLAFSGITHAFNASLAYYALKEANIIPSLLPDFKPSTDMHVTYSNGKSVGFGTIIRPEEAVLQPTVTFQTLSEDKAYTLMMFDADAEVPLVRHWTIANIQGRDPTPAFNSNSPIHQYTPYHGPTPPENTGYHRYIFTLFEQTQFSQVLRPVLDFPNQHRAFFNLTAFINENQLKPVAAAYMLVTHQDGYEGEYKRINSGRFKSASAST